MGMGMEMEIGDGHDEMEIGDGHDHQCLLPSIHVRTSIPLPAVVAL